MPEVSQACARTSWLPVLRVPASKVYRHGEDVTVAISIQPCPASHRMNLTLATPTLSDATASSVRKQQATLWVQPFPTGEVHETVGGRSFPIDPSLIIVPVGGHDVDPSFIGPTRLSGESAF